MLKIPLNPPLEKGDFEGWLVHVRLATDETHVILTPMGVTPGERPVARFPSWQTFLKIF